MREKYKRIYWDEKDIVLVSCVWSIVSVILAASVVLIGEATIWQLMRITNVLQVGLLRKTTHKKNHMHNKIISHHQKATLGRFRKKQGCLRSEDKTSRTKHSGCLQVYQCSFKCSFKCCNQMNFGSTHLTQCIHNHRQKTPPSVPTWLSPSLRPYLAPSLPPQLSPSLRLSLRPSLALSLPPSLALSLPPSLPGSLSPSLCPSLALCLLPSTTYKNIICSEMNWINPSELQQHFGKWKAVLRGYNRLWLTYIYMNMNTSLE